MLNIDLNSPEYLSLFVEEVKEVIERIEANLLSYEEKQDENINRSLKRDFHTLKGDFSTYGMDKYTEHFHELETIWADINNMKKEEKEELISKIFLDLKKLKKELEDFNGVDLKEEDIPKKENNDNIIENDEAKNVFEQEEESLNSSEVITEIAEVFFDFKKSEGLMIDIDEIKKVFNESGKIINIEYINDDIPPIEELNPQILYIKIRITAEINDMNHLKEILGEIAGDEYFNIKKITREEIKETNEKIKKEEEIKIMSEE